MSPIAAAVVDYLESPATSISNSSSSTKSQLHSAWLRALSETVLRESARLETNVRAILSGQSYEASSDDCLLGCGLCASPVNLTITMET